MFVFLMGIWPWGIGCWEFGSELNMNSGKLHLLFGSGCDIMISWRYNVMSCATELEEIKPGKGPKGSNEADSCINLLQWTKWVI
jgi:hypothetical protein